MNLAQKVEEFYAKIQLAKNDPDEISAWIKELSSFNASLSADEKELFIKAAEQHMHARSK